MKYLIFTFLSIFTTVCFGQSTNELSTKCINTKDYPKSKDVSMRICPPENWEVLESNSPNIVIKFNYGTNSYMVLIKDFVTFISKENAKEIFNDKEFKESIIEDIYKEYGDVKLINSKIVTIGFYPALEMTLKGKIERVGITYDFFLINWVIFYEDRYITLMSFSGTQKDFDIFSPLYRMITNSISFPEYYE